jgi:hypothetical protein
MTRGDPRNGHRYRVAVANCLAASDLCHLCGHHGAQTADHLISVKEWYERFGTYQGVNDPTNMAPAHGTKGRLVNPCADCGLMCNQSRGAKPLNSSPRSRDW